MNYRDNVVERLKRTDVLKDGNGNHYVLTHTHDRSPRHFYVIAPYSTDTMNALVAFIQQEASNIEETYGMDQADVIEVLTKLYGCEASSEKLENAYEIDLFLNWEMWASSDVLSIPALKRDGLTEILRTITNSAGK